MKALSVDDLLQGLREEGQCESSGAFTLELERAATKMSRFQMANPYMYCLKWLQAAVCAGAHEFTWTSKLSKVTACMNGVHLPLDRLAQLPGLMFAPQASDMERYLSAGINAVIQTRARRLTVSSWNGTQGQRAVWTSTGFTTREWGESERESCLMIELDRTPDVTFDEIVYAMRHFYVGHKPGTRNARDREQQLLHEHGALAPLRVRIQGFQPDPKLPGSGPGNPRGLLESLLGYHLHLDFPLEDEEWTLSPDQQGFCMPEQHPDADKQDSLASRVRHRYSLFVGASQLLGRRSRVYVVKDGLALGYKEVELGGSSGGMWASRILGGALEELKLGGTARVFVCDGTDLKVDIAGFQVVEDDAWESLVGKLARYGAGSSPSS